jgi:hypothetical protein
MCSLSYIYKLLWGDTLVESPKTLYKIKHNKPIVKDKYPKTLNKTESNNLPTYMSYENMQALCDIQDNRIDYGFKILN